MCRHEISTALLILLFLMFELLFELVDHVFEPSHNSIVKFNPAFVIGQNLVPLFELVLQLAHRVIVRYCPRTKFLDLLPQTTVFFL